MNKFDTALVDLQPDLRKLVRAFMLDRTFEEHENRRQLDIQFTLKTDHNVVFRRLRITSYKSGYTQGMIDYDTEPIPWGVVPPSDIQFHYTKQTLENVSLKARASVAM